MLFYLIYSGQVPVDRNFPARSSYTVEIAGKKTVLFPLHQFRQTSS